MARDSPPVNRAQAMAREIEAKFRISDPQRLCQHLRQLHAASIGRVLETNRIFDTPDRRLLQADCGLRVRTCQALGDAPAAPRNAGDTLAFKGPRDAGDLKSREELESGVTDPAAVGAILARLGFVEVVRYEKRRETWRIGDCQVTLDEVPRLGWYAEIEGPAASRIEDVRAQLGLAACPLVRETYVHLALAHGDEIAPGLRSLSFGG